MHYRRSSPNPPRLLLRIVAAAGAGAVVSACSSGSGGGSNFITGVLPALPSDGGEEACTGAFSECGGGSTYVPADATPAFDSPLGLVADAEAEGCDVGICVGHGNLDGSADGDAELPCGTGVCGSVVSPASDAGDASAIILGIVVRPEGGSDQ